VNNTTYSILKRTIFNKVIMCTVFVDHGGIGSLSTNIYGTNIDNPKRVS